MRRFTLPVILLTLLFCIPGCKADAEIKGPFNDYYIREWAATLEPFSHEIAFYGDSRVALADWEAAFAESDVVNLGVGGDIVEGTIQRLPLLKALDIKTCFLAIGGNNCWDGRFSGEVFRSHYDQLLCGLEDLGITVYICTIAGVTTENSTLAKRHIDIANTNMQKANVIIRQLAAEHNMTLIEMADLMNNPDGTLKSVYSLDGVHFTDAGNTLWYDTLRNYI